MISGLSTAQTFFLLNLISTWYMVGLIWMIQVVHYQLFDRVGGDEFAKYAIDHSRLITPIVGIPMLIELGTAVGMLVVTPASIDKVSVAVGLGLVLLIWASTAFLQVPAHGRLAAGFDVAAYQRLVSTNWIRTLAWSARGILTVYWLRMILLSDSR